MGGKRSRRKESNRDWETSETEENYGNGSGSNNNDNQVSARKVGECEDSNNNGRVNHNASGGGSRQSRGGASSQHEYQPGLGPWTQAVSETVQSMGAAHRAIKDLQDKFTLHMDDLSMMGKTRNRLNQLEQECEDKDDELRRQENTITTLTSINQKTKSEIERKQAEIESEKQWLNQEKEKQEKRISMAMAEEKLKLDSEFENLLRQHGESFDKRKGELEDEFAKQKDTNSRRAAALEAERDKLWTTVEEQERKIEVQAKELEKTTEQCDVLERAKDSVKGDKKALEKELEMMKKEFALNPRPKEYFKGKFAEIHSRIEGISFKYFDDIDGKDLEKVHEQLVAADPCFGSVPIEDSDDSRNLRAAHAQRIISDTICQYIWKPFRSEFTLSQPELNVLLNKISDELDKTSYGGRAANVWAALTMRALQSLPADPLPQASKFKESPHPTRSARADGVVSKVFPILSPLVNSSQYENFKMDLLQLAILAIDTWDDAQTGELKIIVRPLLEHVHREEWRSQEFDPASPLGDYDEAELHMTSKTHPRVFTLFPRVVAREVADPVKHDTGPPGSWPQVSDQLPRTIETYIHPGRGLPECSPLVVRGKAEQEEKNEFLSKALENAKKEMHSSRRLPGHGRRDSMGSSTSGPPSPSMRWKMEGAMKFPEK